MKDKIDDLPIRPSPIPDVIAVVESIWNSLDPQIDILPHIISLPTWIKAAIEANGGHKILVVLGFFIYLFCIWYLYESVISDFLKSTCCLSALFIDWVMSRVQSLTPSTTTLLLWLVSLISRFLPYTPIMVRSTKLISNILLKVYIYCLVRI